jgi:pyruvate/2-oxoglutarate dehydrogenase complex dihydrolipoamide acyltransferase (E2) component
MAEIRVSEDLWATSMLPEGTVERWIVPSGARVERNQAVVQVRVEDALHDIAAPTSGRLTVLMEANAMIEPGSLLGTVLAD